MIVTIDASELGYGGQLEKNIKLTDTNSDNICLTEYFSKNYTATQKNIVPQRNECLQ